MNKGDILYYARVLPGIYDVCELKVRTIGDDYFVGVDKRDKHAYLLPYSYLDIKVFKDREDALEIVRKEESENEEE